jgi:septum formation protein
VPRRLTLASRSPQRRAILRQLGVDFEIRPADVEELTAGDPEAVVLENARRKAAAVEGELVLGADTEVALEGRIFGKPGDEAAAREMLTALRGRTHTVWGGLAVRAGAELRSAAAATAVRFRAFSDAELGWYLAGGEWRERAGGYAIQGRGAALVAGVEGDYLNVVGLPVPTLLELLPDLLAGR